MLEKVLRRNITVRGRALEVLLDIEGKWRGMVHIFDTALPKSMNQDVLVSGAKYDFNTHVITVDAADDVMTKDLEFAVDAIASAAIALRVALSN